MLDGRVKHEILQNIDSGTYIFRPDTDQDKDDLMGFQALVNFIKELEKDGFIKTFEYRVSKKFTHREIKLTDMVIVENLTIKGENELKRLVATD